MSRVFHPWLLLSSPPHPRLVYRRCTSGLLSQHLCLIESLLPSLEFSAFLVSKARPPASFLWNSKRNCQRGFFLHPRRPGFCKSSFFAISGSFPVTLCKDLRTGEDRSPKLSQGFRVYHVINKLRGMPAPYIQSLREMGDSWGKVSGL